MQKLSLIPILLGGVVLVLGSLTGPNTALAENKITAARAHYARGSQMFDAGAFDGAILEFKAADRLVPSAVLDFNIALSYRGLGDNQNAVAHFRRYLARDPQAVDRPWVETEIRRLEAITPPPPAAVPVAPPAPLPVTPPVAAAPVIAPTAPAAPPMTVTPVKASGPQSDSEMDRVKRIDIVAMQRRRDKGATEAKLQGGASTSALPPLENPEMGNAVPADGPKTKKPAYKKWWFWAVVGVSALILIDFSRSKKEHTVDAPPMPSTPLFRF